MNLYDELLTYCRGDMYPMHMPGHKRNPEFLMENPYAFDVTEVEGTDNLHHPEGVIRDLMNRMRIYYDTKESYPLVGGSTCGILAAMSACCKKGDTILVDRNCHRSVYHGIYLLGLKPVYLYRPIDGETGIALELPVSRVEEALRKHSDITCMILTSPTYEGVVSDIKAIADVAHKKDISLIVDEAHGAHLSGMAKNADFSGYCFAQRFAPAMLHGADIVVESLHKTLPALTQTGVLHLCSDRISAEDVQRCLAIYETSSPSYVLMASIAQCMDWLLNEGTSAFSEYAKKLQWFCEQAKSWKVLCLWENEKKEPSKLVIGVNMFSGKKLADVLRQNYCIETEMAANSYVLAMTSPCDTMDGFERLAKALGEIDRELSGGIGIFSAEVVDSGGKRCGNEGGVENINSGGKRCRKHRAYREEMIPAKIRMGAYEAISSTGRQVMLEDCVGEIAADTIMAYPPGIPIVAPGEELTEDVVRKIQLSIETGLTVIGTEGEKIRVVEKGREL